jgi:hypothetical protein
MSRAWMPLYVGDYLRDTRDLSTLQHGAYLLLIMHYWQHDALPGDERQLAAIAGLSRSVWRRISAPIRAKFGEGWRHGRIDAEIGKAERALMQRRRAGQNGGLRSGVARAILQGEAIIAAQAKAERSLALRSSGDEAAAQAGAKRPRTNHNHRIISSSLSDSLDATHVPENDSVAAATDTAKPPCQLTRQELDALFARRKADAGGNAAPLPAALANEPSEG